ncbi:MAG TPA: Stp1/IreP family PP2C-type Ser/Thr phosphatase [Oxalicibacterium sp.]|nr:Stp1/IreP family PP2C-type Ser/Thr phosphatase [Oxalicibacterium sp.]
MTHHLALRFAARTDTGKVRGHNEDAIEWSQEGGVAVLADGMGGYNAGEIASNIATTVFRSSLDQSLQEFSWLRRSPGSKQLERLLTEAVEAANEQILAASLSQPEFSGMGTTLVAALFHQNKVVLAHIGDSRAYRFRQGVLTQLTRDHSQLQEQIDAGLVSPEWARFAPNKNLITRALGVAVEIEVETNTYATEAGDIYLLCSDGLSDMLATEQIVELLGRHADLESTCEDLVNAANDNGGRDNISVILARIDALDATPLPGWGERMRVWLKSCMRA